MINITIPGRNITLSLENLLLDLNGTLTNVGTLSAGVYEKIQSLKEELNIYLLTADTYGTAQDLAKELGISLIKVDEINGGEDKLDFLKKVNPQTAVAIGNGFNDTLMLEEAALSIIIIGQEGCAISALLKADIAVTNITDALDLLLNPARIIATLRA